MKQLVSVFYRLLFHTKILSGMTRNYQAEVERDHEKKLKGEERKHYDQR